MRRRARLSGIRRPHAHADQWPLDGHNCVTAASRPAAVIPAAAAPAGSLSFADPSFSRRPRFSRRSGCRPMRALGRATDTKPPRNGGPTTLCLGAASLGPSAANSLHSRHRSCAHAQAWLLGIMEAITNAFDHCERTFVGSCRKSESPSRFRHMAGGAVLLRMPQVAGFFSHFVQFVHSEDPVGVSQSQSGRKPSANEWYEWGAVRLRLCRALRLVVRRFRGALSQAQWMWSPLPDAHVRLVLASDAIMVRANMCRSLRCVLPAVQDCRARTFWLETKH